MAARVHEFKVQMACGGCSSAVEKALGKLKGQGVERVDISLEDQTVLVTSTLPADQLLETIKKSGKTISYVGVKH
jgi:copper chaperone